jgi:twitching motility protein PilT
MSAAHSELLGRLAVHYQLVDAPQLAHAMRENERRPDLALGEVLVQLGFLTAEQLEQLVEAARRHMAQENAAPAPKREPPRVAPPGPRKAPAPVAAPPAPAQPPAPAAAPTRVAAPISGALMAAADSPQVKWLHQVLASAAKQGASDVHVHAGSQVKARKYGDLVNITKEELSAPETEAILIPSLLEWQRQHLVEFGEVDFSYSVQDVGRYRVNVYKGQSGLCGVYHFIPAAPPLIAALGLPESTPRLVNHHNGLVLITGPSGCGKTSTMAALVNLLNEEREDHILSIEDPIEYVHTSKRCVVNQRQISRHTKSFGAALRSALREDPDVICIGELRDLETISLALSAAETGHLVLGTLHTQGAVRTVSRIIGAYPARQQGQVRMMLSESLRAVISQKLLPRADGTGVVLAYELLFMNLAAANLIRENRTFQLGSVLQTGRSAGMRSMDDSLRELLQKGLITKKVAQLNSENPKSFV